MNRTNLTRIGIRIALILALAPGLATADNEVVLALEIDGNNIEGDVVDTLDREGTIEAISIGTGVTTPREQATGNLTGRRQHKPITITKRVDKTTPLLYKALAQNEPVTQASFRFFRPDGAGGEEHYYTILIENGYVSAVHAVMGKGEADPVEMVSFVFQDITWTFELNGATHTDSWAGE